MQLTGELSEGTPSLRMRTHNIPCHYDILDALVLCVGHSEFWQQVLLQLWLPLRKLLALRIQTRDNWQRGMPAQRMQGLQTMALPQACIITYYITVYSLYTCINPIRVNFKLCAVHSVANFKMAVHKRNHYSNVLALCGMKKRQVDVRNVWRCLWGTSNGDNYTLYV